MTANSKPKGLPCAPQSLDMLNLDIEFRKAVDSKQHGIGGSKVFIASMEQESCRISLAGQIGLVGGGTVDQGSQIHPLFFHWFFKGKLMILKGFLEQFYEVSVMHKAFMS